MNKQVKIFAHRGASGHALENSFKAFNKAVEMKADGIEIDLQSSKDGKLFVFHDANLLRLAGVNKYVYDCLGEEIAEFRLGRKFLRRFTNTKIPSIEQFMEWHQASNIPLNIELKESLLNHQEQLITWLIELELPEGSHFSSFFSELLQIVKQIRPEFETAWIITKKFDWNEITKNDFYDAVHASKKYYKRLYLNLAMNAGVPIRIYGIDGSESFLKSLHPNVVGIITDFPAKVARAINK